MKTIEYSQRLEFFKPKNIEMLVSLSKLVPIDISAGDEDIAEGEICQMIKYPREIIHVGYFNKEGQGRCFYEDAHPETFIEGQHFNFYSGNKK